MRRLRYLMAVLSAAVACSIESLPAAYAVDAITLKMAHQWPDDPNDYVVSTGKKFAQEVMQRSGGKIHIDVFPAESLVKALNMHTALRSGSVDLAIYPYIYAAGAIIQDAVLDPDLRRYGLEIEADQRAQRPGETEGARRGQDDGGSAAERGSEHSVHGIVGNV